MLTKYRPSGVFTSKFFTGAPLVLVGAALLGAVYQVLMHWIPIIYLDFLIVIFMALAMAVLLKMLTRTTHCRNPLMGAGLGFVAGVLAVVVSHWVEYRLQRPQIIAAVPAAKRAQVDAALDFKLYAELRAETGWTVGKLGSSSSSNPTISGVGVYVLWGLEALVIVGGATLGGRRAASAPYCESCGAWADYDMLKLEVPEPSAETTATVRSAITVQSLVPSKAAMTPPPPPPAPTDPKEAKKLAKAPKTASTLRYSVVSCPTCKMMHTLKVEHQSVTTRGNKTENKSSTLHEGVVLTSEEVGRLAELKGAPIS